MMTNNEVAQVFDTVLSTPGMNEQVRIDTRISRKAILLLHQIIDGGFKGNEVKEDMPFSGLVSGATQEELKVLAADCLKKGGLEEINEKLLKLSAAAKK
ncbi:hypothetical protein [Flavobacterium sp. KACC 22758]|uniref:hypothetical protein n=1 Tax=unclassified Flavobacterium TaxID=196869 RepID=UPI002366C652|nr:hypothetical protein [Flavobacterium sp. KACC 22758]WDF58097.1 hypothetical protein PQ462_15375 [Flavobacterium sp. KACC 22758]